MYGVRTKFPKKKIGSAKCDQEKVAVSSLPFKSERQAGGSITACEIRSMTGIMDEDVIQTILASGVSRREIQQACEKITGLNRTRARPRQPLTHRARQICDLIECHRDDID